MGPALAFLAVLVVTGCAGGDSALLSTTATVEVCVEQEAAQAGPAVVEIRQDGEVVGGASLRSEGTAGIHVPSGPIEVYVNNDLIGSGDLGRGASISFSCTPPPAS